MFVKNKFVEGVVKQNLEHLWDNNFKILDNFKRNEPKQFAVIDSLVDDMVEFLTTLHETVSANYDEQREKELKQNKPAAGGDDLTATQNWFAMAEPVAVG